jgi:integrase
VGISYRKHDNGKWEYRIKFLDPFTRKSKEKSKRGFDTKPEARYAAQKMEKKLLEGLESNDHTSLKHFLNEWLIEYKKPLVRKNTFILHKRNIDKHIVPYFKDIKLTELKPLMYQKFLNHLKDQDYAKRTVEIIHGTIYSAMEKAVTLYKIEKNPCVGAEITTTSKRKKKSNTKQKLEYMESGNIPDFLKASYQYGYIYWIFFKILLETGMRKGEAAALQWTDIDLKEGLININKTLDFQTKGNDELFGDTKTFSSKRTISIRKSVANDLRFHMNYQNQNKTSLNDMYRHDLNLVLCKNDGRPMPKSTLFNALERILKRANLPQIPIHALRDTHAVLLLEAGATLEYVQKRLGHRNYQTTVDIYSHISKKIEKDTLHKYENHMDSVLK